MPNIDAVDTTSLASYLPPPVKRHCSNPDCKKRLASLNKGDLCFACQRKVDLEFYTVTNRRYASDGAAIAPANARDQNTADIRLQQAIKRHMGRKSNQHGIGFRSRTPDAVIEAVRAERTNISTKELVAKYKLSPWTITEIRAGRIYSRGTPEEFAKRTVDTVWCESCEAKIGEGCRGIEFPRTHTSRKRSMRHYMKSAAQPVAADPNPGTGE